MPVFHFARRDTGTRTRSPARYSRKPETRISRLRMTRAGHAARRAEMVQERLFTMGADTGNVIEQRMTDALGALGAMRADGKTMRLVAQTLHEVEYGIAWIEAEGRLARYEEALAAGIAVRPLGDRRHRDVGDAELFQHRHGDRELTGAAIDQYEIGPGATRPLRILLEGTRQAAHQHLAHHAVIVAGGEGGRRNGGPILRPQHAARLRIRGDVAGTRAPLILSRRRRRRVEGYGLGLERLSAPDVEFAVRALHQAFGPGDDHRADRIGALDVAVVVDLDAARRRLEAERGGDPFEQLALRGALRDATAERLARVVEGVAEKTRALAALGHQQRDLALGADGQRLGDQLGLGERLAEQDQGRRRLVVVELADEGGEHLLDRQLPVVAGEIGTIAPILPTAEEEYLDRGLAAGLVGGDDVGVGDALHVDVLLTLDMGEGADAVADEGGGLEIERRRGRLHGLRERRLDVLAAPVQEVARLGDEAGIGLVVDAADARRAAALDLKEQAGPRAAGEHAVAARAQQKGALQGDQGAIDRTRRSEGAEIFARLVLRAAMLGELREGVRGIDLDERKRLVVAQ